MARDSARRVELPPKPCTPIPSKPRSTGSRSSPSKGTFDFSNVDLLVTQARQHGLHLVLLWFGTWKNGQNHYVPEWIKSDPKTYPREENAYGKLLDVMSPNSPGQSRRR